MTIYTSELPKLKKRWPYHCLLNRPNANMWQCLWDETFNDAVFHDWLYEPDKVLTEGYWIGFKNKEDYVKFFLVWG